MGEIELLVVHQIADLIEQMRQEKSQERTERDRYIAIAVTEMEKVYAFWATFVEVRG